MSALLERVEPDVNERWTVSRRSRDKSRELVGLDQAVGRNGVRARRRGLRGVACLRMRSLCDRCRDGDDRENHGSANRRTVIHVHAPSFFEGKTGKIISTHDSALFLLIA